MSYQNSHNARYSVPVEDLIRNFANTRFACGLEVIVEFQYKYNAPRNESYFCRVCHQDIAHYNFMLHCCTLMHLYRYTKSRFPIEYSRMVDSDNLSKSTHLIRDIFLKKLSSHQALPKPNLKVITVYSDRDYYMARDDIMKKYPFVELNEIDLNRLIEMNQNEEYDQINEASDIRPEPLPGSVKPTFLKQLMGDDDMDDY